MQVFAAQQRRVGHLRTPTLLINQIILYSDYREERDRLRDKADEYLGMLEDALGGTERREHVFTIRWAIRHS